LFAAFLAAAIELAQADTCGSLKEVKDAARSGFRDWQGSVLDSRDQRRFFHTTHMLPNTTDCDIYDDGRGARDYTCRWQADNPKEARKQFANLANDLKTCLGGHVEITANGENGNDLELIVSKIPGSPKLEIQLHGALDDDPSISLDFGVSH
jgi:hypothetical protein